MTTTSQAPIKVAIIGSGNIGTDLMLKIMRLPKVLQMAAFVGIDPGSDGLLRAERLGVPVTADGIDGLVRMPGFGDIRIVFDATSAAAHSVHTEVLRAHNKQIIDLTPAALGPFNVPVVNLEENLAADNVNMVSCGGQATIPIVAAISRVAPVHYAEIVASIASKSAGPGTRANIDEFTETTSKAIESVGRARRGKAIIVLNPAEPPILMRNTVFALCEEADSQQIVTSIEQMAGAVRQYVPGYRLKQKVQFERVPPTQPVRIAGAEPRHGLKVSVFLEVEGAAHYLPKYAGNLDIMTSAALATGERIARLKFGAGGPSYATV